MEANKDIQVHMLPTEDKSNIVKLNSGNILEAINNFYSSFGYQPILKIEITK